MTVEDRPRPAGRPDHARHRDAAPRRGRRAGGRSRAHDSRDLAPALQCIGTAPYAGSSRRCSSCACPTTS
jgi:hypothetical protein